MLYIENEKTVFFDVDSTLLSWERVCKSNPDAIPVDRQLNDGRIITDYLLPHKKHIEHLKLHKIRNHFVVIWSAGGAKWALRTVKLLGLEDYVDLVMTKPTWVVDDKNPEEYMPPSQWIKDE